MGEFEDALAGYIENIYNLADELEEKGVFDIKSLTDDRFSARTVVKVELGKFLLWLSNDNGVITADEADALNLIFQGNYTTEQLQELADISFDPDPSHHVILIAAKKGDEQLKQCNASYDNFITDAFIKLYEDVGGYIVKADENNTSQDKYIEFIAGMKAYVNDSFSEKNKDSTDSNIEKYNNKIKFILPSQYKLLREQDGEDDEITHIVAGDCKYVDEKKTYDFDCDIIYYEQDSPIIDNSESTAKKIEEAKRKNQNSCWTLPGKPETIIFVYNRHVSLLGIDITVQSVEGHIMVDQSSFVILTIVSSKVSSKETGDSDDGFNIYEGLYNVLSSIRIKGRKLPIKDITFTQFEDKIKELSDPDDEPEETLENPDRDEYDFTDEGFVYASPDKKSYPYYSFRVQENNELTDQNNNLGAFRVQIVNNSNGTEYSFIHFSDAVKDDDITEEQRALYNRIISKDTEQYSMDEKSKEMQKLFHVDPSAFNTRHDRECELNESLMDKAYMTSALRSFAWTVASYCDKNNCTPETLDYNIASRIADFAAGRNWLNYDGNSYCRGLCSGSDFHVFFLPDNVSQKDKKSFLPTQEDIDENERIREAFPGFSSFPEEVHSLNSLRKDIEYIYPSVYKLWKHLKKDRNYDKALTGNEADIVYAWCAFASAAREPFFLEDGPMNCYFSQILTEEDNQKEHDRISQLQDKKNYEVWMAKYGKYIEKNPVVDFNGTVFVFSGLSTVSPCADKDNPIVLDLIEKGGQYRTTISGKTNYLVVNPGYAWGRKCDAAIEQIQKRDNIKIILLEDLKNALYNFEPDSYSKFESGADDNIAKESVDNIDEGWLDNYSEYIENDPEVDFDGKLFAFSGISKSADEKEQPIVQDVIKQGGQYRTSVSGRTDYLVINPSSSNKSKIDSAVKQIQNGKNIKIILLKDLKEALRIETTWIKISDIFDCSIDIDGNLYNYKGKFKKIILPDDTRKIGDGAFYHDKKLTGVIIPEGVNVIEKYAFNICEKITTVSLPDTLLKIEEAAFFGCSELAQIIIPSSCTELGDDAFGCCSKLRDIYISDSVQKIGHGCFKTHNTDTTIHTVKGSQAETFAKEHNIKYDYEYIPEKTKVLNGDFEIDYFGTLTAYNGNAKNVILPDGILTIGEDSFSENQDIVSVIISEGVEIIEDGVFWLCSNLKSVTLPGTIREIGDNTFRSTALANIMIPAGCEKIGADCFTDCKNLSNIYVPKSVYDIGDDAFCTFNNDTVIHTEKYSTAESTAKENDIKFDYDYETAKKYYTESAPFTDNTANFTDTMSDHNEPVPEKQNQEPSDGSNKPTIISEVGKSESIMQINSTVNPAATQLQQHHPETKEGCYIATAVYGSYDSPEVITLRKFRDETLQKTVFGRWFIRTYYRLSPPIAEKLKRADHINSFVRILLDKWVAKLRKDQF